MMESVGVMPRSVGHGAQQAVEGTIVGAEARPSVAQAVEARLGTVGRGRKERFGPLEHCNSCLVAAAGAGGDEEGEK